MQAARYWGRAVGEQWCPCHGCAIEFMHVVEYFPCQHRFNFGCTSLTTSLVRFQIHRRYSLSSKQQKLATTDERGSVSITSSRDITGHCQRHPFLILQRKLPNFVRSTSTSTCTHQYPQMFIIYTASHVASYRRCLLILIFQHFPSVIYLFCCHSHYRLFSMKNRLAVI